MMIQKQFERCWYSTFQNIITITFKKLIKNNKGEIYICICICKIILMKIVLKTFELGVYINTARCVLLRNGVALGSVQLINSYTHAHAL